MFGLVDIDGTHGNEDQSADIEIYPEQSYKIRPQNKNKGSRKSLRINKNNSSNYSRRKESSPNKGKYSHSSDRGKGSSPDREDRGQESHSSII